MSIINRIYNIQFIKDYLNYFHINKIDIKTVFHILKLVLNVGNTVTIILFAARQEIHMLVFVNNVVSRVCLL